MDRKRRRDDPWERIEQRLPGKATDPGRTAKDNRRFVESVLWIMRTGSPWRDLPVELGHGHRTPIRFARWRERGVWERMAQALRVDADLECLFIDSTIVRSHQHSSGAKKSRGPGNRAFARWTDHQTACRGRRLGPSGAGDSVGRTDFRHRLRGSTDRASAGSGRDYRQGVRRRSLCGED